MQVKNQLAGLSIVLNLLLNCPKKELTHFLRSSNHIQLIQDGSCHCFFLFSSSRRAQVCDGTPANLNLVSRKYLRSFYQQFVKNAQFNITFCTVLKQSNSFNGGPSALTFANALDSKSSIETKFVVGEMHNHFMKWLKGACLQPLQSKTHKFSNTPMFLHFNFNEIFYLNRIRNYVLDLSNPCTMNTGPTTPRGLGWGARLLPIQMHLLFKFSPVVNHAGQVGEDYLTCQMLVILRNLFPQKPTKGTKKRNNLRLLIKRYPITLHKIPHIQNNQSTQCYTPQCSMLFLLMFTSILQKLIHTNIFSLHKKLKTQ